MSRAVLVLACLCCACTDTSDPADGSLADGAIVDGGPIRVRDTGCGPIEIPAAPACVMDTCTGGETCVSGPCPYVCCLEGQLETCEHRDRAECDVPPPTECGGGTCVSAGMFCP